jgi:hypothetical protein
MDDKLTDDYFARTSRALASAFERQGIDCRVLYGGDS